jgi:hypothetical protein
MLKHILKTILAVPLYGTILTANAQVVNIDGTWEYYLYRYSSIEFAAGKYTITPIGTAQGGQFDAWNAWDQVIGCDAVGICTKGFLNSYSFGYVDQKGWVQEIATIGGSISFGTATAYSTPTLALSNAQDYTFTLNTPTLLYFYVRDLEGAYRDNTGGMSLSIEPVSSVPLPAALPLMLSSLGVLGFAARRRKNVAV